MKRGVIIFSLALVLLMSAPVDAYSFRDLWNDFTGLFDNLITGAVGYCGYDCFEESSCPEGYVEESGNCGCEAPCEEAVCCREIICGDDLIEGDEECDPPEDECNPGYDGQCDYCNDKCDIETIKGPFCGDGNCDEGKEDENSCPDDCSGGGGEQDGGDDEPDLGINEEDCGDGICDKDEDCVRCSEDCACPKSQYCDTFLKMCVDSSLCGDGICDKDEDCDSCPKDCAGCTYTCGDGVCDYTESCTECSEDCGECETNNEGQLAPKEATKQMLENSGLNNKELKFIKKVEDSLKSLLIFQQKGDKILFNKIPTKKEEVGITIEKTEKTTKISFKKESNDEILKSPTNNLAELTVSRQDNLPKVLLKLFTLF